MKTKKVKPIQSLKKELPQGAVKEIAARTGLSTATVSDVVNGKRKSMSTHKVLQATAEFLAEYRQAEKEALQAINNVLYPV